MPVHEIAPGIVAVLTGRGVSKKVFVDDFLMKIVGDLLTCPIGKAFLECFAPSADKGVWKGGNEYDGATVFVGPPDEDEADGKRVELGGRTFASEGVGVRPAKMLIWYPGAVVKDVKYKSKHPWGFPYHGTEQNLVLCFIHELIHAVLRVDPAAEKRVLPTDTQEEERVVGLCEFKNLTYTENRFRHFMEYPQRDRYVADSASRVDPSVGDYDWKNRTTVIDPKKTYKTVGQALNRGRPAFLGAFGTSGGSSPFANLLANRKKKGVTSTSVGARQPFFTIRVTSIYKDDSLQLDYEVRSKESGDETRGKTNSEGLANITVFKPEDAQIRFPVHGPSWTKVVLDRTFMFQSGRYSYICTRYNV